MSIVANLSSNQLTLFNNEINNMNLLREEEIDFNTPPPPVPLAPTLNTREQEIALNVLNNTPGEDVIVEATFNNAYWRTSRFFYIRYGLSVYRIATNHDLTVVYSSERVINQ